MHLTRWRADRRMVGWRGVSRACMGVYNASPLLSSPEGGRRGRASSRLSLRGTARWKPRRYSDSVDDETASIADCSQLVIGHHPPKYPNSQNPNHPNLPNFEHSHAYAPMTQPTCRRTSNPTFPRKTFIHLVAAPRRMPPLAANLAAPPPPLLPPLHRSHHVPTLHKGQPPQNSPRSLFLRPRVLLRPHARPCPIPRPRRRCRQTPQARGCAQGRLQ